MANGDGQPRNNHHKDETSPLLAGRDPIDMLEENKRTHLCVVLILMSFFLALVGALVVWEFASTEGVASARRHSAQAAAAMQRLNHHLKVQSQLIPSKCETTLLLTRHCEKIGPKVVDDDGNRHCSYLGMERAHYFATLFGGKKGRWPTPSHLFALTIERGGHLTYRQWESLLPLSKKVGLTTDLVNDNAAFVDEYMDMLQSGTLCGRLSVVSWRHDTLVALAAALGCDHVMGCPTSWDENEFDQVLQLKFVFEAPDVTPSLEAPDVTPSHVDVPADNSTSSGSNETQHRSLKKKKKKQPKAKDGWSVYGSISAQYFDPLAYSYRVGDYPDEGSSTGGKWHDDEI